MEDDRWRWMTTLTMASAVAELPSASLHSSSSGPTACTPATQFPPKLVIDKGTHFNGCFKVPRHRENGVKVDTISRLAGGEYILSKFSCVGLHGHEAHCSTKEPHSSQSREGTAWSAARAAPARVRCGGRLAARNGQPH